MGNTTFSSQAQEDYAKRYHINFDVTPEKKTIFVEIPDLPAGNQIKIYLPYDDDLSNSIITGIRCGQSGTLFPASYSGLGTNVIAPLGAYSQFVFSLCDKAGKELIHWLPMYELLQTTGIHAKEGIRGMWRARMQNCYLTYFDLLNTRGRIFFPFVFEYYALKKI